MPKRHFQWIALMLLVSVLLNASSNRYATSFQLLLGEVSHRSLKNVSQRELLDGGISGMLRVCDPHSMLIPPQQYAGLNEVLNQEFGGIGVITCLDETTHELMVSCCLPNSPASTVGLLPGDVIRLVDGNSTKGWAPERFAESVRGPLNSSTHVVIWRPSTRRELALNIPRELIAMESVCGSMRNPDGTWVYFLPPPQVEPNGLNNAKASKAPKKIAYLKVTTFGEKTVAEMQAHLKRLKRQGMEGLVLDLRHNPGGFFDVAIEICDMFVASGVLVTTSGRDSDPNHVYWASPDVLCEGIPIAVLIDGETASASEVLAACLQDHAATGELNAVCVGARTYGKGAIQEVINVGPLPGDRHFRKEDVDAPGIWKRIWERPERAGMKITVAQYRRPNGGKIHRSPEDSPQDQWGVTPNPGMEVESNRSEEFYDFYQKQANGSLMPEQYTMIYMYDAQLKRAVRWLCEL